MSDETTTDLSGYYRAIAFWDDLWADPLDLGEWLQDQATANGGLIRDWAEYKIAMNQRITMWLAHPRVDEDLLADLREVYLVAKKFSKGK